jgi:uncharacterized SAM-binding protein YcdF (DUF218 family)
MPESRGRKILIASAVFACALIAWSLIAPALANLLVAERPLAHADAIVILSGAADYKQRAAGGAAAFREGRAARIILTNDLQKGGWDDTEKGNPYFIERSARELLERGVPEEAIEKLDRQVGGTHDEAELIVALAAERGYRRVLLVTSDFHSKRALWVFDHVNSTSGNELEIGLLRAAPDERYPTSRNWWLSPRGWRTVGAEYLKFAYYWLYY